ncbi:MAG: MBL fold metallo-hydrolase [Clostridiaceae bacterium]|nr:MBL fold metallo-hydrolase [Clostridiaceae bacterium]
MQYFCSFTSGSRGNSAIYVKDGTRILIDAGTNTKYISACLNELGLRPCDLTHIVLTHAHSDHVSALPVLLKYTDAQLVCTEGTYSQLNIMRENLHLFWEGESFTLGDVSVKTAPTPHDCVGSCCYSFGEGDESLAFCTDMGMVTAEVYRLMRKCNCLFIESNHDVEMLKNGPYPYYLKQRVLSQSGHLSNADCADIVSRLAVDGVEKIILGHLSETNNLPRIAIDESHKALEKIGASNDVLLGAAAARAMLAPVML